MKINWKKVIKGILAFVIPVAIFYLFEWYTHNPWEDIKLNIQLLNIFFFEIVMVILYAIIGRLHIALLSETLVFMIYGLVNYFVISFRSQPIQPWDFLSIGTAASVAGDFKYHMDPQAITALIGFLLLIVIELVFCRNRLKNTVGKFYKGPLKSFALRIPIVTVALFMLVGFVSLLHDKTFVEQKIQMYNILFTPTAMSQKDGTAMAFLLELQYMDVDKPQGYNKEEAKELLGEENIQKVDTKDAPNIIVIMDEAFSDLSILGDFRTNIDYMPFMRSMRDNAENAITGNLFVSIKGGNTANSEFEFLTGNSMAFLPQGSIPYQQYIKDETPSLASYLGELGYTTRAAHPYYASGWDRDTVYPLLGFGKADFNDRFTNAKKIRKYISDESAFEHIIEAYERKSDAPLFYFEVTMQNHSGYSETFDNFTPDVFVEDSNSLSLSQYLSLIKKTDEALENFINYFAAQDEKTIIVFFGDHQPADFVVEPIWQMQGKYGSALTKEDQDKRYQVPFLIWANYDIEEESNVEISANYLSSLVCKTAGLPLSNYQTYLEALRQEVPVISAQTVYLASEKTEDVSVSGGNFFENTVSDNDSTISGNDGTIYGNEDTVSEDNATVSNNDVTVSDNDSTIIGNRDSISENSTSNTGSASLNSDDTRLKDIEAYVNYQKMQYYLMFDRK